MPQTNVRGGDSPRMKFLGHVTVVENEFGVGIRHFPHRIAIFPVANIPGIKNHLFLIRKQFSKRETSRVNLVANGSQESGVYNDALCC
jgi:hypothetical protein